MSHFQVLLLSLPIMVTWLLIFIHFFCTLHVLEWTAKRPYSSVGLGRPIGPPTSLFNMSRIAITKTITRDQNPIFHNQNHVPKNFQGLPSIRTAHGYGGTSARYRPRLMNSYIFFHCSHSNFHKTLLMWNRRTQRTCWCCF